VTNRFTQLIRRPWMLMLVLGTGLSALFGSGLFAAVVDAGASQSNSVSSAEFSGIRNLQIALTTPTNTTCTGALDWQDNLGPASVGSADLNAGALTLTTNQRLCIRARRAGTFNVRLGLRLVLDSETGCSTLNMPEAQSDNDSCGNGGVGELSRVLTFGGVAAIAGGSASNCAGTIPQRLFKDINLDQGATSFAICVISGTDGIATFMPNLAVDQQATSANLTAAQSDKVQFNYAVSLETN
jgi:hypothetical protein